VAVEVAERRDEWRVRHPLRLLAAAIEDEAAAGVGVVTDLGRQAAAIASSSVSRPSSGHGRSRALASGPGSGTRDGLSTCPAMAGA
jgi:hypothetical protein